MRSATSDVAAAEQAAAFSKTGLAQRIGDDLIALVPDGATDAQTDDGEAVQVSRNLLVAGRARGATFELDGKSQRVTA
jgi:hypothetical protein